MIPAPDRHAALALKAYFRLARARNFPGKSRLLRRLRSRYISARAPVPLMLHGFPMLLNPGNSYPFLIREVPLFNAPLVELAHQVFLANNSPLSFVDVGSATGDTVLLLKQNCPGHFAHFFCLEGDPEFFALLSANMAQFSDVELIQVLLARQPTQIRSLVKHHAGTAAATGEQLVPAIDFDSVAPLHGQSTDILKIDVDGFDGEVLAGATQFLKSVQPAVIFEWHPQLVRNAGNNPLTAFETLSACGYRRFLWFHNVGTFSHLSSGCDTGLLQKTAAYLLRVNGRRDEHFDVVALPENSRVNEVELAALDYARTKLAKPVS